MPVPTNTSITIQGDAEAEVTTTRFVTLQLAADDAVLMTISNQADLSGGVLEAFVTSKSWVLTEGDGVKTVYVKFQDGFDNEAPIISDTIILDSTVIVPDPDEPVSIRIQNNQQFANSINVNLILSSEDAVEMMLSNNQDFENAEFESFVSSRMWDLLPGDGVKTVYVRFKDQYGNISETFSDSVILDTKPPKLQDPPFLVGEGQRYFSTRNVVITLNLDSTEDPDNVEVLIDNLSDPYGDPINAEWQPFQSKINWLLTDGNGLKTVRVKFRDIALNETQFFFKELVLLQTTNIAPTITEPLDSAVVDTKSVEVRGIAERGAKIHLDIE